MDGFPLAASISFRGYIAMETAKRERQGWMPYVLAAGFVLLASGAALPHAAASFAGVIHQIRSLFS